MFQRDRNTAPSLKNVNPFRYFKKGLIIAQFFCKQIDKSEKVSKMIKYIFQIFILVISLNSNKLCAQTTDSTFYFRIEAANDSYDSETATFKRKYRLGEEAFQVQLTKVELRNIYQTMTAAQFTQLPSEFKVIGDVLRISTPHFSYSLESNHGGTHKKIIYSDRISSPEMITEVEPFLTLYYRIWEIIRANEQVARLKRSNIFYE